MFRSLYSKLAAGLTVLFFIVGLLFVGITVFSTDMYQQEVNQKLNSGLAQQIVAAKLLMQGGRVNEEAIEEIFHMLMVINPSIEIYLLDTHGNILTFSAPKGTVKRGRIDLDPIKRWLGGDMTIPLLGDDPRDPNRKKVFSAARISDQGGLEGYLYVILGGQRYDSAVQKLKGSYILQLSAWMISAGLLFALITGLILFALLTGRLKRLAKVMDDFRRGDAHTHVDYPLKQGKRSADEIDRLGSTFKEMAERIEKQMEELKRSDELPFANADIALVERALENLIENAIHFSPTDGTVTITLALEEDILVRISDNGPGIPQEEIPHIFKRFYHADRSHEGREGHSGLGLAITKRIIELHHRSINVASSAGTGTSFTFYLPVFHAA